MCLIMVILLYINRDTSKSDLIDSFRTFLLLTIIQKKRTMLTVTNTTLTKEATITQKDCEYYITYTITNGIVTLITCSIRKNVDSVLNEVGSIRKENGQVNSFIRESEDYISHLKQFAEVVEEVEKKVVPIDEK